MYLTPNMIDRDSPIPLYRQVYNLFNEKIEKDELIAGSDIPGEEWIAKYLGVSRPTVRSAMAILYKEGKIRRYRGRGTVVTGRKKPTSYRSCTATFNEDTLKHASTKVLYNSFALFPDEITNILGTSIGIHLVRLRFAEEEPIAYTESFIKNICQSITHLDMSNYSLYQAMSYGGYLPIRAHRTFKCVLPPEAVADYLRIPKDSYVFCCCTTSYHYENTVLEHTISYYRNDLVRFELDLDVEKEMIEFMM